MAKTKISKSQASPTSKSSLTTVGQKMSSPPENSTSLLQTAAIALQQGDASSAIVSARRALGLTNIETSEALPALNLLGEISVELGEINDAREYFLIAANLDEDGSIAEELGGGAEKFLWLAQLNEEGGADSVGWFERGARCLRNQIQQLLESSTGRLTATAAAELESILEEKRKRLSTALCGVVEVYMTDLSWEADAEAKCEALVTEATMVAPGAAEPWQTLANVRLSQERPEDAKTALRRSIDVWQDLPPEDADVPDFPTRVSLARLLMEADMEDEAIEVLERLVSEDDESVEVWYLGGWALYLVGEKQKTKESGQGYKVSWISSRQWLNQSMRLYQLQEYEDERLGEHAKELITSLDQDLGGPAKEGEEEDDDDDEGDEDDSDEIMADS